MPRIRCPNCGTSINLEARRELDYKLILIGMQKGSKTFTDLLKITGLPRKTLSLRLAALRDSAVIVKDGGYSLNGSVNLEKWGKKMNLAEDRSLTKPSFFTRRNVLILVMALVIAAPIAANAFATLLHSSSPSPQQPSYIGTFKMDIKVYDTIDLFAWQAMIRFNQSELVVAEAIEGNFLKAGQPYDTAFLFASDTGPDQLLAFGSMVGMDAYGTSGDGTLATITFGYKTETYKSPKISYNDVFQTFLWNSYLKDTQGVLTLEIRGD